MVRRPKPVASASRASATIEADSTVRKTVVRLIASFQIIDQAFSRSSPPRTCGHGWPRS
jgi:hypothetical protein